MRQVVIAVVALLIGLLVGWLLPRGQAPVSAEPADGQQAEVTAPPPQDREAKSEPLPQPALDPEPGDTPKPPKPALPRGDGEIRGKVTYPDGTPAAGVVLIASPAIYASASERQDALRASLESRAVVDAEGAILIRGLVARDFALRCESPEYELEFVSPNYDGHGGYQKTFRPGDFAVVTVHARVSVELEVVMDDGTPCAAARVNAMNRGQFGGAMLWTPDEPHIRLRAGAWTLHVAALQDDDLRGTEIVEARTGERPRVLIHLARPAGLRVVMRLPEPWYTSAQYSLYDAAVMHRV